MKKFQKTASYTHYRNGKTDKDHFVGVGIARAFAYKMKLEAIKHQGERSDLTSRQVGEKSSTCPFKAWKYCNISAGCCGIGEMCALLGLGRIVKTRLI